MLTLVDAFRRPPLRQRFQPQRRPRSHALRLAEPHPIRHVCCRPDPRCRAPRFFVSVSPSRALTQITAAAILQGLSPGSIAVNARLVQGTGRTQGVFIEMFVTAALCLVVLQFATNTKARRQDDRDVHGLGNANGTGGLLGGPGDRRGYASSGHRTRTVSHFYPIAIGLTTFACHLWAVACACDRPLSWCC